MSQQKIFTEEDMARYKRVFNLFDVKKNGVIEAKEFAAVSKAMGYRLAGGQMSDIMKALNLKEGESITFEQFLQAMPGNTTNIDDQEHKRSEYRRKFQEYDKDGEGVVTIEGAYNVLKEELGFNHEKSERLVKQFAIKEENKLSYEEFIPFYINVKEKKASIDKAFREFDRGEKGYVSLEDAIRILGSLEFTDQEVKDLVDTHDTNRDGRLHYQEFVHFWSV